MRKIFVIFLLISFFSLAQVYADETAQRNPWLEPFKSAHTFLNQIAQPISLSEDQIKVRFNGEFRYRLEYRDDYNFNDSTFEDSTLNLLRTQLGMQIDAGNHVKVYVQGQDSEGFAGRTADKSNGFVNRLDLHQLYAEIQSPTENLPLKIKVGRQELSYGDQRFVGAFDWSNVARVFDAVKLAYTPTSWLQVDAWFSQVVRVNKSQADSAQHDDNFYGVYAAIKPIQDHVIDTFLFIRHNQDNELVGEKSGQRGQLKEYTVGNRAKGKKWGFDYGVEWAWQFGSRAHDDISAWAWHQELGYTFSQVNWTPRLGVEYNYASGDSDPRDGKVETFDNLYPTNHLHYGYIDFISLKNIHDLQADLTFKPHPKLTGRVKYHWLFLATNSDAWYNAGQGVVRGANPGASTTLGQELDLLAKWQCSVHYDFLIGYSYFHAGAFVRDTGTHDDANFFYVQNSIKF